MRMEGDVKRARNEGRDGRRFEVAAVAIRLFSERGLDATTAEDIATAAGISPRTFFRYFPTKEEAVFPDHEERVAELQADLADPSSEHDPVARALEISRTMMAEYFFERDDVYRPRYELVRKVPALREFERISDLAYERVLAGFFSKEYADKEEVELKAQLAGAAIVTALNHVIDLWAGREVDDPRPLLTRTLETTEALIRGLFEPSRETGGSALAVVVSSNPALRRRVAAALADLGLPEPSEPPD